MSAYAYDMAASLMPRGELRWAEDDFNVVLVSGEYEPRQDIDRTREAIADMEVSPPIPLMNRTVDDSTPMRVCLRSGPGRFLGFTGAFRYAVIFKNRSEELIAYSDLGPQQVTNGDVLVEYPDGEVCELIIE